MTSYTGIQGQNILIVSSDPANPTEGQIWYNSTSNLLKGYANVVTNAWASGGNYPQGVDGLGTAGTQTATVGFAGGNSVIFVTAANLYDGTSWTATGSMGNTFPNGRAYVGAAGTQTSALGIAGYSQPPGAAANTAVVESFNGTTWSPSPAINTARRIMGCAGISTAALIFGGYGPNFSTATESYNGSSWTTLPATLPTGVAGLSGAGTQTAALSFGGDLGPAYTNTTASYNGSAWTTVNSLNTARGYGGGFGIQTAALYAGGGTTTPQLNGTELWNGTSWTTNPTGMSNSRIYTFGNGTQTSGLITAGQAGPPGVKITATEEWTGTQLATRTITVS